MAIFLLMINNVLVAKFDPNKSILRLQFTNETEIVNFVCSTDYRRVLSLIVCGQVTLTLTHLTLKRTVPEVCKRNCRSEVCYTWSLIFKLSGLSLVRLLSLNHVASKMSRQINCRFRKKLRRKHEFYNLIVSVSENITENVVRKGWTIGRDVSFVSADYRECIIYTPTLMFFPSLRFLRSTDGSYLC